MAVGTDIAIGNSRDNRESEMATDRYADLLKQGFMKPGKAAKAKAPIEIVSCSGCQNWHAKGKHTEKDAAVRRSNVKAEARERARIMEARRRLGIVSA